MFLVGTWTATAQRLDPPLSPTVTFTMFYGAAPDEATALDAVETAGAERYSLAQADLANGTTTGEPNTFIWDYKAGEGGYQPPAIAALTMSTAATTTPAASVPGFVRQ